MADDDNLSILKRSQLFKGLGDGELRLVWDFAIPSLREYEQVNKFCTANQ